jgi:hypothetical protein
VEEEVQGKTRIFWLFFGILLVLRSSHKPTLELLNRRNGMRTDPIIRLMIRASLSDLLGFSPKQARQRAFVDPLSSCCADDFDATRPSTLSIEKKSMKKFYALA